MPAELELMRLGELKPNEFSFGDIFVHLHRAVTAVPASMSGE